MTRADDYREACVEYAEACLEFRAWERSPRINKLHSHWCDCTTCLPRRALGERASAALNRAWDRVVALRPAPEEPTPEDIADERGDEKMEARRVK